MGVRRLRAVGFLALLGSWSCGAAPAREPVVEARVEKPRTPQAWLNILAASDAPLKEVGEPPMVQCGRLIDAINEGQESMRDARTDDAEAMLELAEVLEKIVSSVRKWPVDNSRLNGLRRRYVQLISGFSATARRTAFAMASKNLQLLQEVQVELTAIGPKEDRIIADINSYCQKMREDQVPYALEEEVELPRAEAACEEGQEDQCEVLAGHYVVRDEWGKLEKLATHHCRDKQDHKACVFLGELYSNGTKGTAKNMKKSLKWSAQACLHGLPQGCFIAGRYYQAHPAKVKNVDGATLLFARACAARSGRSCIELAKLYPKGKLPKQSLVRDPLVRACREGKSGTCSLLVPPAP